MTLNFINYNELSPEELPIFGTANLENFVNHSKYILARRLGTDSKQGYDGGFFSAASLDLINKLIIELLDLIQRNSNPRGARTPSHLHQHAFFSNPFEQTTFSKHLYISRFEEIERLLNSQKKSKSSHKQKKPKLTSKKPAALFSKQATRNPAKAKKMKFGPSGLNETETRAVAVLYMVGLVWASIKKFSAEVTVSKFDNLKLAQLLGGYAELHYLLYDRDPVAQSIGGKSGEKSIFLDEFWDLVSEVVEADPGEQNEKLAKRCRNLALETEPKDAVPCISWFKTHIAKKKKEIRLRN
jgi:hypothetical protein